MEREFIVHTRDMWIRKLEEFDREAEKAKEADYLISLQEAKKILREQRFRDFTWDTLNQLLNKLDQLPRHPVPGEKLVQWEKVKEWFNICGHIIALPSLENYLDCLEEEV